MVHLTFFEMGLSLNLRVVLLGCGNTAVCPRAPGNSTPRFNRENPRLQRFSVDLFLPVLLHKPVSNKKLVSGIRLKLKFLPDRVLKSESSGPSVLEGATILTYVLAVA